MSEQARDIARLIAPDPSVEVPALLKNAHDQLHNARLQVKEMMDKHYLTLTSPGEDEEKRRAADEVRHVLKTLTYLRTYFALQLVRKWSAYQATEAARQDPCQPLFPPANANRKYLLVLTYMDSGASEIVLHADVPPNIVRVPKNHEHLLGTVDFIRDRLDKHAASIDKAIDTRLTRVGLEGLELYEHANREKQNDTQYKALRTVQWLLQDALTKMKDRNNPKGIWAKTEDKPTGLTGKVAGNFNPPASKADVGLSAPAGASHFFECENFVDKTLDTFRHFTEFHLASTSHIKFKYVHPQKQRFGLNVDKQHDSTIKFCNQIQMRLQGEYEADLRLAEMEFKLSFVEYGGYGYTWANAFCMTKEGAPTSGDMLKEPFDFKAIGLALRVDKTYDTNMELYGKSNEITAMVEAVRAGFHGDQPILNERVLDKIEVLLDKPSYETPQEYRERIVQYASAYYSTDNPDVRNLGSFGDRSMYILNVQGRIMGVRTYTKNLFGRPKYLAEDAPPEVARRQAYAGGRQGFPRPAGWHREPARHEDDDDSEENNYSFRAERTPQPGQDDSTVRRPHQQQQQQQRPRQQHQQQQQPPRQAWGDRRQPRHQPGPAAFMPEAPAVTDALQRLLDRMERIESKLDNAQDPKAAVAKDIERLEQVMMEAMGMREEYEKQRKEREEDTAKVIRSKELIDDERLAWGYSVLRDTYSVAPKYVYVRGLPWFTRPRNNTDTVEHVEYIDITFTLDAKEANDTGILVYKSNVPSWGDAYLNAYPTILEGQMKPKWEWRLIIKGYGQFYKAKNSHILIEDDHIYGTEEDDVSLHKTYWVTIHTPEKINWFTKKFGKHQITLSLFRDVETMNEQRSNQSRNMDMAKYYMIQQSSGTRTLAQLPLADPVCALEVYGPALEQYALRIYDEFSSKNRTVDYFGTAPRVLHFTLHLCQKVQNNTVQSEEILDTTHLVFQCTDSENLTYECILPDGRENNIILRLKKYLWREERKFTWGITYEQYDFDEEFFGHKALTREVQFPKIDFKFSRSPDIALLSEQASTWTFKTNLDTKPFPENQLYRLSHIPEKHDEETFRRAPNHIASKDDPRANIGTVNHGVRPFTAYKWHLSLQEDRLRMNIIMDKYQGKKKVQIEETETNKGKKKKKELKWRYVSDGPQYRLAFEFQVWDNATRRKMSVQRDGGKHIGPQFFNAPMYVWLEQDFLNGKKVKEDKKDNPDDSQFWLLDSQGPVYVSMNGKYMLCPTGVQSGTSAEPDFFWALYKWYDMEGRYQMLARKHRTGEPKVLLTDHTNRGEGQWSFLGNFAGDKRYDAGEQGQQRNLFGMMLIYVNIDKLNGLLPKHTTSEANKYGLAKRFPDYVMDMPTGQGEDDTGESRRSMWGKAAVVPSYLTTNTPWAPVLQHLRKIYEDYVDVKADKEALSVERNTKVEEIMKKRKEERIDQIRRMTNAKEREEFIFGIKEAREKNVVKLHVLDLYKKLQGQNVEDLDALYHMRTDEEATVNEILHRAFADTPAHCRKQIHFKQFDNLLKVHTVISMKIPLSIHPETGRYTTQKAFFAMVNPYTMEYVSERYGLRLRPTKCGEIYVWRLYQFLLATDTIEEYNYSAAEEIIPSNMEEVDTQCTIPRGLPLGMMEGDSDEDLLEMRPATTSDSQNTSTPQAARGGSAGASAPTAAPQRRRLYNPVEEQVLKLDTGTRDDEYLFATKVVFPSNLIYWNDKNDTNKDKDQDNTMLWRLNGTNVLYKQDKLKEKIEKKEKETMVSYQNLYSAYEENGFGYNFPKHYQRQGEIKPAELPRSLPQDITHEAAGAILRYMDDAEELHLWDKETVDKHTSLIYEAPTSFVMTIGQVKFEFELESENEGTVIRYKMYKSIHLDLLEKKHLDLKVMNRDNMWIVVFSNLRKKLQNEQSEYAVFQKKGPLFAIGNTIQTWACNRNDLDSLKREKDIYLESLTSLLILLANDEHNITELVTETMAPMFGTDKADWWSFVNLTTHVNPVQFFHKVYNPICGNAHQFNNVPYMEARAPQQAFSRFELEESDDEPADYNDPAHDTERYDTETLLQHLVEYHRGQEAARLDEALALAEIPEPPRATLPLQPRKLGRTRDFTKGSAASAPLRTFATWSPPAAGGRW